MSYQLSEGALNDGRIRMGRFFIFIIIVSIALVLGQWPFLSLTSKARGSCPDVRPLARRRKEGYSTSHRVPARADVRHAAFIHGGGALRRAI